MLRNIWGVLLGGLFGIFALGGVWSGYYFYDTARELAFRYGIPGLGGPSIIQPRVSARDAPDILRGERVNILLLGVDLRPQESGPTRTDTLIVVTLDPATGTAGMLSIPRDLWVEIPGFQEGRINQAHFFGDAYNYPGGGPALAMRTVEYNLGIPIHYYVRINFQGFREIVDTLGGITVDVPSEIRDDRYPDEDYGYMSIYIPAGVQTMDGETALRYARTRHGTTDFERARRQQQVLLAIRDKALNLNLLPRLPDLIRTLGHTVDTNLTPGEVLALAPIASSIDPSQIKSAVIDETMTVRVIMETGADVLFPDRVLICQIVEEIFHACPQAEENA